ncbi:MAG: DUF935 family protein [Pseudomonadota bacterium]
MPGSILDNQIARAVSWLDRWTQHPSYGLTPSGIAQIYSSAEAGAPAQQCDLFDDMIERDGHLRSQLDGRLQAVMGKDWILEGGGDSEEDARAAVLLELACRATPSFWQTIKHQLKDTWYGYSLSEIVWGISDGLIVPTWFGNVPHRRVRFGDPMATSDASSSEPRLLTKVADTRGVALEPGRWIWGETDVPAVRAGVMRTATWWAFFKKLSVRDWIVFSERFGLPYVTGEYSETASDADKSALKEAVAQLGKDGAAVFAETCKLVIHQVERGGKAEDIQGSLTALCNAEMSKLVSGATLISESGGPGSFALGRVHQERSFDLIDSDAKRIADRFADAVGKPFVVWNGLNARPPRLRINVMRETDPLTRSKVLSTLANELGLALDEDQVRKEFSVKRPVGAALNGTRKSSGSFAE